jgi:hypothetical protein
MKPRHSSRNKRFKYSEIYSDDSDDEEKPTKLKVKNNDFVVVKVFGKKHTFKLYVACISKCLGHGYQVRFMRRCTDTKNKFIFSSEPESCVNEDEVLTVLKEPSLLNSRGVYVFDNLPQQFKLLN